MKRFVKRNIKYIIAVLLLFVLAGIALGNTRIRSVDTVRQEARELAGDVTMSPDGIRGSETNDGDTDARQSGGEETAANPKQDKEKGTGGDGRASVSPTPQQTSQTKQPSESDQAESTSKTGDTKQSSSKSTSATPKASKQNGSTSKTAKSQTSKRKVSDGKDKKQDAYHTDPIPSGKPEPVNQEEQTVDTTSRFYVYLSIDVKTILNHMDDLTKGLEKYVPEDGVILPKTKVVCYEGETVWDVLSRECKARNINVESTYTQFYGSVYLEGINNIGQFDCGPLSGWMYAVDGWFPNYGCSRYVLAEGEYIQWRYSCTGGGKDLDDGTDR
ncbi:MAG: DUF4430 domain-containing protein [Eubacteriales bacterium]|nr:DUF4430 domain-containing protein [Eubacteriales bacterium]